MANEEHATWIMTGDGPGTSQFGDPAKPTLLAFHGSGSNMTCHRVQLARMNMVLKKHFNVLVFNAPFPSPAGPGILPFFDGCGPFARWLPPTEKVTIDAMRRGESTPSMAPEVEDLVRSTILALRAAGGRVVGLIGFSQGTKVVAGLLKGAELRQALGVQDEDWCDFSFAVSVCASYPPPLVPPSVAKLVSASTMSDEEKEVLVNKKISTPVFHVQGKKDEWNWAGQNLIEKHYEVGEEGGVLVEWDMGHHYPLLPAENESIGEWAVEQLKRSGIL